MSAQTLLVVEDDPMVRDLVRRILARQGYDIVLAADGEEALTLFAKHDGEIELVLADVVMPRMGGRELVERLLTVSPGMKVLYMSGYEPNIVAQYGIDLSEVAFLEKPFTPERIVQKIRDLLDPFSEALDGLTVTSSSSDLPINRD